MKIRKDIWILALVGVLLGFLIIRVIEAQHPQIDLSSILSAQSLDQYLEGKSLAKLEEHIKEMENLEKNRDKLLDEVRFLEGIISDYEEMAAERVYKGEEIREQLKNSRMLAGMIDIEGPGVEIILDDRKRDTILDSDMGMLNYYIVHDSDLLEVINELRAAGAEAISVNGVRIMGSSRISCGGPTINVGKEQRFAPPFVIHALGDPDALAGYFKRDDSVYQKLSYWGLRFDIKKKDIVQIPRYIGDAEYRYARPVGRSD